jgi:Fe-S-cluster containining protein
MSSDLKKQHDLDQLYAQLPKLDCKGLCHTSCGPIGMTQVERRRIQKNTGGHDPGVVYETLGNDTVTDVTCSLLQQDKRCGVYAIRPMICRLWGIIDVLKCPYGCVPEGGHLTYREGQLLMLDTYDIDADGDAEELAANERVRQKLLTMTDEELAQNSQLFVSPPVKI